MDERDSRPMPAAAMIPHPARCSPEHPRYADILRLHAEAVVAGRETYNDPASGFRVFTARYLWDRGHCCDSGCRHCPYVER